MSEKIEKLTDFQHARRRTEMYLSSRNPHTQAVVSYGEGGIPEIREMTWVPAVFTAFREILDNALDEVVTHRHGTRIDIHYDPKTGIFKIADDGRGIPITFDAKHNQYLATLALTETKAGRNFGERGSTRGLNGVGASVVNFCSDYFEVVIHRDKKRFSQRFCEGDGTQPDLVIEDPLILPQKRGQSLTGTAVEFKLSRKVFHDLSLPEAFIRDRVFEVALCYPNLKVTYNGETVKTKPVDKELFPNHKPISIAIDEEGFQSRFWLVPLFFSEGQEHTHGLVNAIPLFNGGAHIDMFRKMFFAGLLTALERESKRRKLNPNRSDIADGMLIYNITEATAPSFDSQSKTRLINETFATLVKKALDDPDFFKKIIRAYPDWIEAVYRRCAERTERKDAADLAKAAKKNARLKVEALADACGKDRQKCVLFLTEGNSAVSGIVEMRDPDIHGALPLRGKVLNVHGVSPKDALASDALLKVMQSIGLTPGQKADRKDLRYGRVYLCVDADEDGKSIAGLLTMFFFKFWPELFQDPKNPYFYIFDTPLIIAVKGNTRKYWFADDVHDFEANDYKGYTLTRAKGLAALVSADWKALLKAPKLQAIVDDGKLKETLDLLFNEKRADDRKAFMGM